MNIFLDFDGTIVDPATRYHAVYARCLARCGDGSAVAIASDRYWSCKRERMPERDILAHHHPAVDPDAYHAARMQLIEDDEMLALDPLVPGSNNALSALRARGSLYLVTMRRDRDALMRQLAGLGITDQFARVLSRSGGDRPADVKVDLMRGIAVPGDWIAGDTEADMGAGKTLGLTTCAVTSGIRTEAFLRGLGPDYVVGRLAELPALLSYD